MPYLQGFSMVLCHISGIPTKLLISKVKFNFIPESLHTPTTINFRYNNYTTIAVIFQYVLQISLFCSADNSVQKLMLLQLIWYPAEQATLQGLLGSWMQLSLCNAHLPCQTTDKLLYISFYILSVRLTFALQGGFVFRGIIPYPMGTNLPVWSLCC